MALIADSGADRVEQLLIITERLAALAEEETRRIEAREPPLEGGEAEEKQRLANAYRLELARIKDDPGLIGDAPPALLAQLKARTAALHEALGAHETALAAVKMITEGLVQAMAEELVRLRGGGANYGAGGALEGPTGPSPAVLDRQA